jgi:Ca-activated chloride channel family protein
VPFSMLRTTRAPGIVDSLGIIAFSMLFATFAIVRAQSPADQADQQFRVDTSLVLVPVTVTDFQSANITGLGKESFSVLDNGLPQPISVFYLEDAPCSVGIVLDVSGSMRNALDLERAAMHAFLEASNPEDDSFLVTVSSNPGVLTGPVGDTRKIDDSARFLSAGGGTALIDTIYRALSQIRSRQTRRRALLVISDGIDNYSRYSKSDLMRTLVESGIQVYTIAIAGNQSAVNGIEWAEVLHGFAFMEDLAAKSGGVSVRLGAQENPSIAATRLANAIRNQYVVGYRSPDNGQSGKWHRILVKVNRSDARIHARSGYLAH